MEHGINKMDKVYYYDNNLYIRINDKNDYLLTLDDLYDNILVWNIQNELVNEYKMYCDYITSHKYKKCEESWDKFKREILSSLQYKVYKRINND